MLSTSAGAAAAVNTIGGLHHHGLDLGHAHDTTCYYFVCRLCALKCGQQSGSPGGVAIFSDEGQLRQVRKKIHDCLQFHVNDADKFPRTVCRDCLYRLDEAHEFLIKCLESQQFLADLATHEVFDEIYDGEQPQQQQQQTAAVTTAATTTKHDHQHQPVAVGAPDETVGFHHQLVDSIDATTRANMNASDQLPDTCTIAADLEKLVDEAHHMHASDSTDITQMIQYHDGSHDIHEVDIHNHMARFAGLSVSGSNSGVAGACTMLRPVAVCANVDVDDDSLPDITLYSFDGIDATGGDSVKVPDGFDLDVDVTSAVGYQAENAVDYADRVDEMYTIEPPIEHRQPEEEMPRNVTMADLDLPDALVVQSTTCRDTDQQPDASATPSVLPAAVAAGSAKSCAQCAKTFRTNYKLNQHMRTHTQEQPFQCSHPNCGKSFRSKPGLVQHEAQHTGTHQFACPVCGKGFQVRGYLTSHMKCHSSVKPFRCGECGEEFRARQTLVDHEARHLGVKAFACARGCELRFVSKALCVRHEKLVHGVGGDDADAPPAAPVRFACTLCAKQFTRRAYLKTHMLSHTGERPFACDVSVIDLFDGHQLQ